MKRKAYITGHILMYPASRMCGYEADGAGGRHRAGALQNRGWDDVARVRQLRSSMSPSTGLATSAPARRRRPSRRAHEGPTDAVGAAPPC